MNKKFRSIPVENVIFFDIETASAVKELDPKSEMFKVFQYKNRDKETEKLPTVKETQALYKKIAALSASTGIIICITLAYVKDGKIVMKSLVGDEKEIISEAYRIMTGSSRIFCSFNGQGFDHVFMRQRAVVHNIEVHECLNDVDIKPWSWGDMGNLDLMKLMQGTSPFRMNFDEVCMMLGVPSPKNTGIHGSQVSEAYHEGRIEEIKTYCEADVKALVNVFLRMQGKPIIE